MNDDRKPTHPAPLALANEAVDLARFKVIMRAHGETMRPEHAEVLEKFLPHLRKMFAAGIEFERARIAGVLGDEAKGFFRKEKWSAAAYVLGIADAMIKSLPPGEWTPAPTSGKS